MSYKRINFKNLPNQTTPINASNLNKMDEQIYVNDFAIEELQLAVSNVDEKADAIDEKVDATQEAVDISSKFTFNQNLGTFRIYAAYKFGKVITFLADFTPKNALPAWTNFMSMDDSIAPFEFAAVVNLNNSSINGWINSTNMSLTNNVQANEQVRLCGTWISME